MLSFDTVHTLTGCLITLIHDAAPGCWDTTVTLSVLHDRPVTASTDTDLREMTADSLTVTCDSSAADHGRLPDVLDQAAATAWSITTVYGTAPRYHPSMLTDVGAFTRLLGEAQARVLAWAVCYHDVLVDTDAVDSVRRVDAVDADGRVYHLTLLPQDTAPVVLVDDEPDPCALPATYPGLHALLTATTTRAHAAT